MILGPAHPGNFSANLPAPRSCSPSVSIHILTFISLYWNDLFVMCLFSQTTFILEVLNFIRYIFEAFESPDLNTAKLKKVCRPDWILILLISQLSLRKVKSTSAGLMAENDRARIRLQDCQCLNTLAQVVLNMWNNLPPILRKSLPLFQIVSQDVPSPPIFSLNSNL